MKFYTICLLTCLASFSNVANADTPQQFCDTLNSNTQLMFRDISSSEFKSGQIGWDQLVANYSQNNDAYLSQLNIELMKTIYDQRDKVSAEDVNKWVYQRCVNDWSNHQKWWTNSGHSRGRTRASDYLAPSVY
jgi:hypothetical protein